MANKSPERNELRLKLVQSFAKPLADAAIEGDLEELLEDIEKIERYIIGETE